MKDKKAVFILRIVLCLTGVLGVLWFVVPGVIGSLLNVGSFTGMTVATLLFAYGVALPWWNRLLARIWGSLPGKVVLTLLAAAAAVILLITVTASILMISAAGREPESGSVVIVLGCRVRGEAPSLMLQKRLEAAYRYLTEYPDAVCVLSGGQGEGEDISEAECMYRYLTKKGIGASRLYLEENSTSTRENLLFTKKLLEQYGLGSSTALVTNEFHQYRAGRIAASLGLTAGAVPSGTAWWLFPTYYVRELYAILYDWIFY